MNKDVQSLSKVIAYCMDRNQARHCKKKASSAVLTYLKVMRLIPDNSSRWLISTYEEPELFPISLA